MKIINRRLLVTLSVSFLISLTNICKAQTEINIQEDSLPKVRPDELHKKYKNYAVSSIVKNALHQEVIYSLEIQKKTTLLRLVYSGDGKLISKYKSKILTYDGTEPVKSKPSLSNDKHNHQH